MDDAEIFVYCCSNIIKLFFHLADSKIRNRLVYELWYCSDIQCCGTLLMSPYWSWFHVLRKYLSLISWNYCIGSEMPCVAAIFLVHSSLLPFKLLVTYFCSCVQRCSKPPEERRCRPTSSTNVRASSCSSISSFCSFHPSCSSPSSRLRTAPSASHLCPWQTWSSSECLHVNR